MDRVFMEALRNGSERSTLGRLADYIPELTKRDPNSAGLCVIDIDGRQHQGGDCDELFTMQSISKVIALVLAMEDHPHDFVYQHVGLTSSAEAFNSIMQLETKNQNKPLNPFINAGAILTLSLVKGDSYEDKFDRVKRLTEVLSGRNEIFVDEDVYLSEKQTGDRNRALAYFMSSTKVLGGEVEMLLDAYFKMCSMLVNCRDLARIGATLANDGCCISTGKRLVSHETVHAVNAIMASCGMYDGSGEFAVKVGIPSKSGVGGGILSVIPKRMGIGVFGPALDGHGNSVAGVAMLKHMSKELSLSIY